MRRLNKKAENVAQQYVGTKRNLFYVAGPKSSFLTLGRIQLRKLDCLDLTIELQETFQSIITILRKNGK
jgi:hypothetical protein